MEHDHPSTPTPRRGAILGAIVGMAALTGTIIGVSTVAGAQADPTTDPVDTSSADEGVAVDAIMIDDADFAAFDECMSEQLGDLWIEPIEFDADIDELDIDGLDIDEVDVAELPEWTEADEQAFEAADEACQDLLPAEVLADMAAWEPYEACVDEQIGELDDPFAGTEGDEAELSEADWEAYDAAWSAADEACRDLLPADLQAELAEWDAYDTCVGDLDGIEDGLGEAIVFVETGDGSQIVNFGEVEGSVTITGTADGVTVATDGGVTVLDEAALDAQWAEFDAAHEACEDLLPEDVFEDMGFEDMGFEEALEVEGTDG